MEKKDRNVMPGDNEIVTKKGFLITPPKMNRSKKPLSSILNDNADQNKAPRENRPQKQGERAPRPDKGNRPERQQSERPERGQNERGNRNERPRRGNPNEQNGAVRPQTKKQFDASSPREDGEKSQRPNNERRPNPKNRPPKGNPNANPNRENRDFNENRSPADRPNRDGKNNRRPEKGAPNRPVESKARPDGKPSKGRPNPQGGQAAPKQSGKPQKRLSVLSDLGFNSESFFGRKAEPERVEVVEEKIDYSKAIPLRDQIYPPKIEKAPEAENDESKIEIIGVRFKEAGKIYYFDPDGQTVPYGTPVIVETARGREYGYTAISNRKIPSDTVVSPLKKIIRLATEDDRERLIANKEQEKAAVGIFNEKVKKLKLDMNLVGVEYTFDNTKLLFYFTSEGRVDFRELVKELASVFRTRIELRQVGVRDEAKLLGGLGVCGRPLCCKTFLGEFAQVSIKMAKDQNLSLNSAKISGTCGRLLCCLRYEDEVYQKEYERTPKVDAIVETKDGKGIVTEANPLKGTVKVRLNDKPETPPQLYARDDVTVVGYAKNANKDHSENAEDLKNLTAE